MTKLTFSKNEKETLEKILIQYDKEIGFIHDDDLNKKIKLLKKIQTFEVRQNKIPTKLVRVTTICSECKKADWHIMSDNQISDVINYNICKVTDGCKSKTSSIIRIDCNWINDNGL